MCRWGEVQRNPTSSLAMTAEGEVASGGAYLSALSSRLPSKVRKSTRSVCNSAASASSSPLTGLKTASYESHSTILKKTAMRRSQSASINRFCTPIATMRAALRRHARQFMLNLQRLRVGLSYSWWNGTTFIRALSA